MKKYLILLLLLIPSLAWGTVVADIDVLPSASVEVGEEVFFSASDTTYDGTAALLGLARYEWDFGDGYYLRHDPNVSTVTRSGITTTHYFMAPDTYTVTLSTKIYAGFNTAGNPVSLAEVPYGKTLGMGSTKTNIANAAFKYVVNGTTYTLAANAVGTAPGDDVVPRNCWGAVRFDVGTDGVVDVKEAAGNAGGYGLSPYCSNAGGETAAVAAANAVALEENHVTIGVVPVFGNNKAFTFGTTEFDDALVIVRPAVEPVVQTVKTSIFSFNVGGTIYTLPATATGYSVGDDVIPSGRYGAIALDVGSDLEVHTIEATDNATGYTTAALARAGLPAVAENHVRMAYVTMRKSDGPFVCGLTSLIPSSTITTAFTSVESTPIDSDTETVSITVTGTAPMTGFEIQRANFNNRTKQYLYIQIPSTVTAEPTNKLKVVVIDTTADPDVETVLAPVSTTNYSTPYHTSLTSEEIYLLDHTTLTAGHDYVLQAQLFNASDEQLTGGIWRDKFAHWSTTPTVAIDENNSFVVGGELFFPMGPYLTDTTTFNDYLQSTTVLHSEGYAVTHNSASWDAYLDAAVASDILAIGPGRGDYPVTYTGYATANRWQFNHDPDVIEGYITDNKDHAGLFAWAWQDEPNMGGRPQKVYSPVLAAWGYIGHANDPNHPYGNNFLGQDWSDYYTTHPHQYDYLGSDGLFGGKKWVQDFISFDSYPAQMAWHPAINFSTTKGPYEVYVDLLKHVINDNKNLVPVLPTVMPNPRECNYDDLYGIVRSTDQAYMEAWINVINGAKGVLWFQYHCPTEIEFDSMNKFATQIKDVDHIVLLPASSTTVTDDSNSSLNRVDHMERDYGGDLWIFSVRVTEPPPIAVGSTGLPAGSRFQGIEPTTITTTFTVDGLLESDYIIVKDENRTITHGAGWFQDTFDKNEVHIYQITSDAPGADTTDPVVNSFSIPETYEDLELPITIFQCSDAVGVTHYLVNEVVTEPSLEDANWATSAQTSYTFADRGAKTLYAWCKDAAGNISASKSDTTTLTTPNYNVSITVGAGCVVSPSTTQSIASGSTASFIVTPEDGYIVAGVSGCGGTWSSSPYETAAITEACAVTASCNATQGDSVVSTSVGTGCSITPTADQTVIDGSMVVFNVKPQTGYDLESVTGCGGTLLGGEYTTEYINESCTVTATCSGHLATIGSGGTITLGSGGSGGGSSCSTTTDKVGTDNTGGSPPSIARDTVYCSLYTPSCYGSLSRAYVAHSGTGVSSGKVCVYSDDGDSTANVGDLKIGCSGDISSGSTEWAYSDMDGGTLTSGSYWVCFAVKADATSTFALDRSSVTYPLAYKTSSGFYASPPDTLNGLSTSSSAGFSMYVTVGP
jgi:hypothetical protein